MNYYQLSKEDVAKTLKTNLKTGLTQEMANTNLKKYGKNKLIEPKKRSLFLKFIDQLKDFMILILLIASILSFVTNDILEGIFIIAIILVNAIIGVIQEAKAEKSLKAIQKLSSPHAKVIRDGVDLLIDAEDITVGDLVILQTGDYVPADLRIIESVNLKIDESALTGESLPVEKKSISLKNKDIALGDKINLGYMSTVVTYGRGLGIVTNTGMETEIGKIATMISEAKSDQTPLQKSIAKLGKTLAIIAIIISIVIFAINIIERYIHNPIVIWDDWKDALMASIALAVAAIPEGLPAIITIVLAIGMQNLARQKAIMKSLPAVETLGSTSIICSDKTGTLTQNAMTVTKLYLDNELVLIDNLKPSKSLDQITLYGLLCNDTKINLDENGNYQKIGDPTEIAFVDMAINLGYNPIELVDNNQRIFELPFDSERKLMTTVHDFKDGRCAIIKGAPDVIFNRTLNSQTLIKAYHHANQKMTEDALRVLAIAYKKIDNKINLDDLTPEYLENDLLLIGLIGMIDPPRSEVKEAIKIAYQAGIQTIMITGDHKNTAVAIAKELNIINSSEDQAITGLELDLLDDESFKERLPYLKVYARVSPENKVRIVKAWKAHQNIVAMTGDGVNDAPALKEANIGIAMGITGTEVSKGAADLVLTDDNFTTIVNAVSEGRGIYANIQKAIHFLLSCNSGEIISIFLGTLIGSLVLNAAITPLTAVQILWVNLVTDSLLAISIGLEKKEKDIMAEKPRDPNKSFFSDGVGIRIIWQGLMIGLLTFGAYLLGYFIDELTGIPIDDTLSIVKGSTFAFMVLSISQITHSFNIRSENNSVFKLSINKWHIGAVIISLFLQIITIVPPFTRNLFEITALNWYEWLIVLGLSLLPLLIVEIQKLISFIIKKRKKEAK